MIYVKDVARGMAFYRDLMGFKLIEDFRYEGTPVYARLREHLVVMEPSLCTRLDPERPWPAKGSRLYFEVRELDDFCRKLQKEGLLYHPASTHDALGLAARLPQRSRRSRDQPVLGRRKP